MVDWQLAGKVAEGVAALQPAGDPGPFRAVTGPAEESERLVGAYTGLRPVDLLPVAEAVDRPTWIRANLTGLQGVLDPAAERVTSRMGNMAGPVGAAAGSSTPCRPVRLARIQAGRSTASATGSGSTGRRPV